MVPILELDGVGKGFPGVRALVDVSFDVRPGEVHALLGENGAGKSTLIKIMSGVYAPDTGTLRLDGEPIRLASPTMAQAAGIATIYQELLLFPELSVAENIFIGHAPRRRWGGIDWTATRRRARELLDQLDCHDLDVDTPTGTLSIGNRQRVEIAKALSQRARVLIMDEPTAALAEADVVRLIATVRTLRGRGVGIVYISHRLTEVTALADRVTVLRDGAHVGTLPIAEVDEERMVGMMVGRAIEQLFPKVEAPAGEVALEARGLAYRDVVESIDFTVRAGEIVGLAGLVGSGRTEVAQTIFGITPATEGEILVGGRSVRITSPRDAKHHGIAYVPEDRGGQGIVRAMPIGQNVSMAVLRRLARAWMIDRRAETALAQADIARFAIRAQGPAQLVGQLSGGNQQKVVLAKWLATRPRVLIMDEPTRGIDVGAKAEIHRLMGELAKAGMAILMISSELPEILGMSDRVLVMREGRLVAEIPRALATSESVGTAMMRTAPQGIAA